MKKKIIVAICIPILILLLSLGLSKVLLPKAAFDADFTVNGSVLTKYNGAATKVTIPSGIREIGANAFAGNPMVENVIIPEGVETIGYAAFSDCRNLKNVTLPESLIVLDDSVFNGDEKLTDLHVGASLRSMGSGVFGSCVSLKALDVSDKNVNFKYSQGCLYSKDGRILYMYLPGYTGRQYKMPDTVEEIKRYAFWGCPYLEDVMLSTSLKKVDDMVFSNCHSLETITVYLPLNNIGIRSFDSCINLKQVILPASVNFIHDTSFDNCNPSLIFVCNDNGYSAKYAKEHGIQSFTTPRYLAEYVEEPVVESVSSNTVSQNVVVNTESEKGNESLEVQNPIVTVDGDVLFSGRVVSDKAYVLIDDYDVKVGSKEDANKPSTDAANPEYRGISDYAFYNQKDLNTFTFNSLGNSIAIIGKLAFARSGLREINIPDTVETISYGAFYHCDELVSVNIPSSVKKIEAFAFDHTPWMDNWYKDMDSSDFMIVGDGILLAYKGLNKDIVLPDGVKCIADQVFRDHTEIETIIFPDSLITIGRKAFAGCSSLKMIQNSENVHQFEEDSFENCPVSL